MKKQIPLLVLLITAVFLAGCSPKADNRSTTQSVGEVYPGIAQQSLTVNGYPSPDPQDQAMSAYPSDTNTEIFLPPEPPATAPEPEKGKASISGALYSFTSKIRLPGTQAYLTRASGEQGNQLNPVLTGPQPEIGDITFSTDNKGNFELNNIPPGKYFIIVWAPYSWSVVQKSETDNSALLFDLVADQPKPVGIVVTSWP